MIATHKIQLFFAFDLRLQNVYPLICSTHQKLQSLLNQLPYRSLYPCQYAVFTDGFFIFVKANAHFLFLLNQFASLFNYISLNISQYEAQIFAKQWGFAKKSLCLHYIYGYLSIASQDRINLKAAYVFDLLKIAEGGFLSILVVTFIYTINLSNWSILKDKHLIIHFTIKYYNSCKYKFWMGFYDILSIVLTAVGLTILVYRTVNQLQANRKNSVLEKLCTKWVIFMIFLKFEYWILAIVEILPLGALGLLFIKLLLFMPENPISHKIYKAIQKKLEKVKLDDYHSQVSVYISFLCKYAVVFMIKIIKKIAEYVNSRDIEDAEAQILQILKIFEYKKAAVHMRSQAFKSQINDELNDSQLNSSYSEESEILKTEAPKRDKTDVSNRISKILADIDDDGDVLKIDVELMVVKPNKQRNQKAKYEPVKIQFFKNTRKIVITDWNKAVENGTLKQVKWITKNMINIELIFDDNRSKVIKLNQKSDVPKWVEPVCEVLQKK